MSTATPPPSTRWSATSSARVGRVRAVERRELVLEGQRPPVLAVGRRLAVEDRDRAVGRRDDVPELASITLLPDRAGARRAAKDRIASCQEVTHLAIGPDPGRHH